MNLDDEILKAEKACEAMEEFSKTTTVSMIERLRPWVHLQNLLFLKTEKLINMKRIKINKLYKDLVDLRDYDVDKCIAEKQAILVEHGKESMLLTWEKLQDEKVFTSKEFPSRTGGKPYKLYSYKWQPKTN